eukprot:35491_1
MSASWKLIDDFGRGLFEVAAEEEEEAMNPNNRDDAGEQVGDDKFRSSHHQINSTSILAAPTKSQAGQGDDASNGKASPQDDASSTASTNLEFLANQKAAKEAKPKRPLSAYNLFYRFKRSKILQAHDTGGYTKETIHRLIMSPPGLEDHPTVFATTMSPQQLKEYRAKAIRDALQQNLAPKDAKSKRSHSKTHGMGFLEINEMVGASWRGLDDFSKSVLEELAEEGRKMYKRRVAEYEEKYPPMPSSEKRGNKSSSSSNGGDGNSAVDDTPPKKSSLSAVAVASKELPPVDIILDAFEAAQTAPPAEIITPADNCHDRRLPFFPHIFEPEGSSQHTTESDNSSVSVSVSVATNNNNNVNAASSTSTTTRECILEGDFPYFARAVSREEDPNKCGNSVVSEDDFMKLFEALDN